MDTVLADHVDFMAPAAEFDCPSDPDVQMMPSCEFCHMYVTHIEFMLILLEETYIYCRKDGFYR